MANWAAKSYFLIIFIMFIALQSSPSLTSSVPWEIANIGEKKDEWRFVPQPAAVNDYEKKYTRLWDGIANQKLPKENRYKGIIKLINLHLQASISGILEFSDESRNDYSFQYLQFKIQKIAEYIPTTPNPLFKLYHSQLAVRIKVYFLEKLLEREVILTPEANLSLCEQAKALLKVHIELIATNKVDESCADHDFINFIYDKILLQAGVYSLGLATYVQEIDQAQNPLGADIDPVEFAKFQEMLKANGKPTTLPATKYITEPGKYYDDKITQLRINCWAHPSEDFATNVDMHFALVKQLHNFAFTPGDNKIFKEHYRVIEISDQLVALGKLIDEYLPLTLNELRQQAKWLQFLINESNLLLELAKVPLASGTEADKFFVQTINQGASNTTHKTLHDAQEKLQVLKVKIAELSEKELLEEAAKTPEKNSKTAKKRAREQALKAKKLKDKQEQATAEEKIKEAKKAEKKRLADEKLAQEKKIKAQALAKQERKKTLKEQRIAAEIAAAQKAKQLAEEQAAAQEAQRIAEAHAAAQAQRILEEQAAAKELKRIAERKAAAEEIASIEKEKFLAAEAKRLAKQEGLFQTLIGHSLEDLINKHTIGERYFILEEVQFKLLNDPLSTRLSNNAKVEILKIYRDFISTTDAENAKSRTYIAPQHLKELENLFKIKLVRTII